MRRTALPLLLALFLASAPFALHADEAPLTRVEAVSEEFATWDLWYGLYLGGTKSGWAHERVSLVGSGRAALWVIRMDARIRVQSFGQTADMAFGELEAFDGQPPYAFKRHVSYEQDPDGRRTIRVDATEDGVRAQITEGGETRERTGPRPDYTFADYATFSAWIRTAPDVGDSIRVRDFDAEELESDVATYVVTKRTEEIASGVPVPVWSVDMSSQRKGDGGEGRAGADGRMLKVTMGNLFEFRLEPEEIAKKTEIGGDVFLRGTVKVDRPLGDPTKVSRLVLEVKGEARDALADAPGQEVLHEDGRVILRLGFPQEKSFEATPEEIEKALEETTDHPIHHPAVIALAKRAIGDADTEREKVARLVAFVEKHVKDANVANSVSVIEMIKTPKGDCTEHALLFTALAKASGIPAREIGGLMYMGDKYQAFGGHAWCEVVLDGRWVPVDPAWGQVDLDATHITVTRSETDSMRQLEVYGGLAFELRELETSR